MNVRWIAILFIAGHHAALATNAFRHVEVEAILLAFARHTCRYAYLVGEWDLARRCSGIDFRKHFPMGQQHECGSALSSSLLAIHRGHLSSRPRRAVWLRGEPRSIMGVSHRRAAGNNAARCMPILCRGKLVGVINVQHRQPYHHTPREVQMISTIGFLVGGEIEMAPLESEKTNLSDQLETRKHVERAKGILQREFGLNEEDAYRTMQKESRQRRKTMRDISEAIVLSEELRRDQSGRKQ
jgi:GAF domain-containing protein